MEQETYMSRMTHEHSDFIAGAIALLAVGGVALSIGYGNDHAQVAGRRTQAQHLTMAEREGGVAAPEARQPVTPTVTIPESTLFLFGKLAVH